VHLPDPVPLVHVTGAAFLTDGAARYAATVGLRSRPDVVDFAAIVACPVRARQICAAYLAGPVWDRAAVPAYRRFIRETAAQFEFLTRPQRRGGLGVQVAVGAEDPYPDAAAMVRDLVTNQRLRVYATGGPGNAHSLLSPEENDMFRAVHDAFGHAASGRGFDRHGEEAAWRKHLQLYSPLARLAMTTETRGQTSVFIWHLAGRRFPTQKTMLLPSVFCTPTTAVAPNVLRRGRSR
jgi:hypothetical protein